MSTPIIQLTNAGEATTAAPKIQLLGTVEMEATFAEKEITANGEYPASDDGVSGYSKVTVNVPIPECSGKHVIPITEFPTENIDEEAIYKLVQAFSDLIIVYSGSSMGFVEIAEAQGWTYSFNTIPTKTTENIQITDVSVPTYHWYYIEDENDIFIYGDFEGTGTNSWVAYGSMDGGTFNGCITDASEATAEGYYAVGGTSYYQYVNSTWEKMIYESDIPIPTTEEKTVTPTKSTQTVTPSDADYLSQVTVNPIPDSYIIPSGTLTVEENGTHPVTDYASVEVNVPIPTIIEAPSEITANGTYTASEVGADGISEVTVNVPTYITVATVDDLPTDSADGTIAIVEG